MATRPWGGSWASRPSATLKYAAPTGPYLVQPTGTFPIDEEASGPDGITIKGRFLADLFATYELTPDPDREYPCELKGHVGETVTNAVTFTAKVPA